MLEYDIIDISEKIGINKINASKECNIFHYWNFKDFGFKYEPYLCNGGHGLMQKARNFNDVAIVSIKGSDYKIPFWYMSKNDSINIINNSNLNEKSGSLYFFLLYIKMSETTYYERNRDVILNRAKHCYKNDEQRLRNNTRYKYKNSSEEGKIKREIMKEIHIIICLKKRNKN